MSLVDGKTELEHLKEDIERLDEQAYYMGIIEGIKRKENLNNNGMEYIEYEALQLPEKKIKPALELLEKHGQPDDKEYLFIGFKKIYNVGFRDGLIGDTSEEDLPHYYEELSKLK
jgi:hypothetical protein